MCRQVTAAELLELVKHQLNSHWGAFSSFGQGELTQVQEALRRFEICFADVKSKYYHKFPAGEGVTLHVENTVQYSVFLYYLSNSLYKAGKTDKASLVYYLNKLMHSVELFYAIELPEHFSAEHPLGAVMGNAVYGDYFFFYQGCTVGGNPRGNKSDYPMLGKYVTMYSNSKILGASHIGNHVVIAANAYIKDTDIPDYSIVYGQYSKLIVKTGQQEKIEALKQRMWLE